MSRRAHHIVRLFLSGMAALFAYTVVITSRPAAVAASARAPKRTPAAEPRTTLPMPSLPDPRQRLLQFGR